MEQNSKLRTERNGPLNFGVPPTSIRVPTSSSPLALGPCSLRDRAAPCLMPTSHPCWGGMSPFHSDSCGPSGSEFAQTLPIVKCQLVLHCKRRTALVALTHLGPTAGLVYSYLHWFTLGLLSSSADPYNVQTHRPFFSRDVVSTKWTRTCGGKHCAQCLARLAFSMNNSCKS